MNWLTCVILVMLALHGVTGYRKGLIKTLVASSMFFVSIILTAFVTPGVSSYLKTETGVYEYITEQCQESFSATLSGDDIVIGNDIDVSVSGMDVQNAIIDQLPLPDILKDGLKKNNTTGTYQKLAINSFNEYVPKYLASIIINALSFVVTWILVRLLLGVIVKMLDLVSKLPGLNITNKLLGAVVGVVKGLVIVWAAFLLITIFGNTATGGMLLEMIADSPFLGLLYDTNLFMIMLV